MPKKYAQYINREQNNKTIVTILWLCIVLIASVELLNYVIYQFVGHTFVIENFFYDYIIFPLCLNSAIATTVTLLCWYLNKKHPYLTSYIVTIGFVLFIHGVITVHYGIRVIYMAYVLPIFISVMFIDKYLTTLTAILSLTLYLPLYLFYLPLKPDYTYKHDYIDLSATIVFSIACYIASLFIMNFFNTIIIKINDVSKLKVNLEKRVQLDSFTQLYNRASFDETLESYFQKSYYVEIPFTTIILDIDNFKHINDTYGHALGDEVILKLVRIIIENTRKNDKAFRYGGEEFALILETDEKGGFEVAEKIRILFHNTTIESMKNEPLSISLGVCQYHKSFLSTENYFTLVDAALYKAKREGKNKTVIAKRQDSHPVPEIFVV